MIVEDGSIIPNANSYVSIEYANEYFSIRNNSLWVGEDFQKEGFLIRSTDYIEGRFGNRFIGQRVSNLQSLSWPRKGTNGISSNIIPVAVKNACCEYAVRAIQGALAPDVVTDASGAIKATTREKVGPLEESYSLVGKGVSIGSGFLFKPYPEADMWLRSLLVTVDRTYR